MNAQTLTIDRVFDSRHRYRGSNGSGPKCTELGLEIAGNRHFMVVLDGWLEISAGSRVTALFRSPGDWKQLVGWVDHETGEIVRTGTPASLPIAIATCLITALWIFFLLRGLWIIEAPRHIQIGLGVGTIILSLVSVGALTRAKRTKAENVALMQCKASLSPRSGA